jgi:hypothetical protein
MLRGWRGRGFLPLSWASILSCVVLGTVSVATHAASVGGLPPLASGAAPAVWAASGSRLAYQSVEGLILADRRSHTLLGVLDRRQAVTVAWAPDGRFVAWVATRGTILEGQVATAAGRVIWAHPVGAASLLWIGSRWLVVAGRTATILFNPATRRVARLLGHPPYVRGPAGTFFLGIGHATGVAMPGHDHATALPGTRGDVPQWYGAGQHWLVPGLGAGRPRHLDVWARGRVVRYALPATLGPFVTGLQVLAAHGDLVATAVAETGMVPALWVLRVERGHAQVVAMSSSLPSGTPGRAVWMGDRFVYGLESPAVIVSTTLGPHRAVRQLSLASTTWYEWGPRIALVLRTSSGPALATASPDLRDVTVLWRFPRNRSVPSDV